MTNEGNVWTVAEAKARFSQLLEQARSGPQVVTRHGRKAVVVVAAEEWERRTARPGSLADFLASSPLPGSNLEVDGFSAELRDPGL